MNGAGPIQKSIVTAGACLVASVLLIAPGRSLDVERAINGSAAAAEASALFSSAFTAYAAGEKARAFDAYRAAADLGHIGALWKVGRIYELGDGAEADAFEAFRAYRALARLHGDIPPKDRDAVFVASAFVALGRYLESGIGSRLERDPAQARGTYFYAASYFGDREAQYRLGRMLIDGVGGPPLPAQGVRWLKLASDKGHVAAVAVLGELLFDGRYVSARPVLGLSMLTRARRLAAEDQKAWIEPMQERAFAAASEEVRRQAVELAEAELNGVGG